MKYAFVILLVVIPFLLFSQEPPKKSQKVILLTKKSKEENYAMIGSSLLEHGVDIEKTEEVFGMIQTSPITNGTFNSRTIVITFIAKEGSIEVKGKFDPGQKMSNKPLIIKFSGMKGSSGRKAWEDMVSIIELIGDFPISYEK